MSKYIDAGKLKEIVNRQYRYCHGYTGTSKDIYREALLAVKSAIHCQSVSKDMQEIVRCKDCKHYVAQYCTRDIKSRTNMFYMCADDFCSYGERKNEK